MKKSETKSNKSKPHLDISRIDTPEKDISMMNQSMKEDLGSFFKFKNSNSKFTNSFSFNDTRTNEKNSKSSFLLGSNNDKQENCKKKLILKSDIVNYKSPDFYRDNSKDETQYRLTELVDLKNQYRIGEESDFSEGNMNILKLESEEGILNIKKVKCEENKENFDLNKNSDKRSSIEKKDLKDLVNIDEIFGSSLMKFGGTEDISKNFDTFKSRDVDVEDESSYGSVSPDNKIFTEIQEMKKNHYLVKKKKEANKENYCFNQEVSANPYSSRNHYFSSQAQGIFNTCRTLNSSRNHRSKKIPEENFQRKPEINNGFFSKRTHNSYSTVSPRYQENYKSEAIHMKTCDLLKEKGFEITSIDTEKTINDELFKVSKGFLDMCKDIKSKLNKSKMASICSSRGKYPTFGDSSGYKIAKFGVKKAKLNLKGNFGIDVGDCSFNSGLCGKKKKYL